MKTDFDNETMAEARASADDAIEVAADAASVPDAAQEQPKPSFAHVLAVWFTYFRPDGTSGADRVFVFDCPDIRTRAQMEHYEALLAEQGKFSRVIITNWRSLEG